MQNGQVQQPQQQQQPQPPPQPHQGVLWKRRDVFKNRWRPRWFCLQANQGVLTYYLLTAPPPITANFNNNNTTTNMDDGATTTYSSAIVRTSSSSSIPTNSSTTRTTTIGRVMSAAAATRSACYGAVSSAASADDSENDEDIQAQQQQQEQQQRSSLTGPPPPPPLSSSAYDNVGGTYTFPAVPLRTVISTHPSHHHHHHHRDRTTSWDSQVSENTVDYDVVPRGSIYLLGGCTVEMNESLSKPREHVFAFTIKSPHQTEIHLAARSAQARRVWVEKLWRVCDCATSAAPLQQQQQAAAAPPLPLTVSLGLQPRQRSSAERLRAVPSVAEMNEYHEENDNADDAASEFFQEAVQEEQSSANPTELTTWQSTSPTSSLYANVPADLAQDIQHRLDKYLPMIDESSPHYAKNNWTKLFERNGHEAYVTVLPNSQQQTTTPGTPTTNTTTATPTASTEGTAVVKTIAYLEHSPRQVFNLLMDPSRRREYESDVRSTCRLQTYNPHTFLDLTLYNPIWPMSARELATVVHWQVMSKKKKKKSKDNDDNNDNNNDERSLVLVAFSCPQAQALQQPVESRNVVQAHLLLSLFVLRPMADYTATQMIRLVSLWVDPKVGGFYSVDVAAAAGSGRTRHGGRLQKFVLGQMAGLSTVMARYLQRHEPLPPSGRLTGPLDNALIIRDIIQHLPDSTSNHHLQRKASSSSSFKSARLAGDGQPQQDDADGISRNDNDDDSGRWDRSITPLTGASRSSSLVRPALERQATCLLAPVLLFQMLQWNGSDFLPPPSFALVLFCIAAFYAIRQVVLWHIETIYPSARKTTTMMPIWENNDTHNRVLGPMTCRFTVDLKGIIRFVTNKKEDREELGQGTAEVSVIHLVASALARALKKEASLRQRRVTLPWLWIDKVVDVSSDPIRVSVSENGGRWLTLDCVDSRPVQDIADDLAEQEERQFRQNIQQSMPSCKTTTATTRRQLPALGECLVLATPDMDQSDPDTDFNVSVLPSQALANNVAVVAVIGGVKLEHYGRRNSGTGISSTMHHAANGSIAGSTAPAPRPVLTLTLTILGPLQQDTATTADFVTCRRLAEDVKILLQFPEMCE